MLRICTKLLLLVLLTVLGTACEPELLENPSINTTELLTSSAKKNNRPSVLGKTSVLNIPSPAHNLQDLVLEAVIPTECGATKLSEVGGKYFEKLLEDPQALEYLDHYIYLNRQAARLEIATDYFGKTGSYTQLVKKLSKDLNRFYVLPHPIEILGQHNSTLQDREKLADIYWYSIQDMESKEEAYLLADEILKLNQRFPELINSPFISSDGFATRHGDIVIGDGLIKLFVETGLSDQIVWTGIIAHEWAHQVQFHFLNSWYPEGTFEDPAERTRTLELEADFFSGYFMTHKRGATYNWKRAEEFFELFYQAGDCSFEFEQHHGTPIQRKQASHQGFLLAEAAKKKGEILTAEELHLYFILEVFPEVTGQLQYL